jgi:stage II sporulation protein M
VKAFSKAILEYFKENLGIYILVSIFFLLGISSGAFLIKCMQESRLIELNKTVSHFMTGLNNAGSNLLEPVPLLKISLQKNGRFLFIVWLLGFLRLGFLPALFYLVMKGLALGFTVGFLVKRSALKGVVFSLAAVLPHNFLLIPAYLIATAVSSTYSLLKFKNRFVGRKQDSNHFFLQYSFFMSIIFIVMLMGVLVEAYITPVFIKLVSPLF